MSIPKSPTIDLGTYHDYMAKEMHDQPAAVGRVLAGRLDERWATAHLGGINIDPRALRGLRRVTFLGCGSAYYAGEAGALLIEELARIPADAQPASEFRYRNPVIDPDTLYIAVSQSGETADTLMAVEELKRKGARVIGAVNVVGIGDRPGVRGGCIPARGPGGCGRVDQGAHEHDGRVRPARADARPDS